MIFFIIPHPLPGWTTYLPAALVLMITFEAVASSGLHCLSAIHTVNHELTDSLFLIRIRGVSSNFQVVIVVVGEGRRKNDPA